MHYICPDLCSHRTQIARHISGKGTQTIKAAFRTAAMKLGTPHHNTPPPHATIPATSVWTKDNNTTPTYAIVANWVGRPFLTYYYNNRTHKRPRRGIVAVLPPKVATQVQHHPSSPIPTTLQLLVIIPSLYRSASMHWRSIQQDLLPPHPDRRGSYCLARSHNLPPFLHAKRSSSTKNTSSDHV
jgi:hypothetical protein